jgi:hypothetical protein
MRRRSVTLTPERRSRVIAHALASNQTRAPIRP